METNQKPEKENRYGEDRDIAKNDGKEARVQEEV